MALAPCRRCRSPLELGDLLCAVCGIGTPSALQNVPAEARATILRCGGCGAAVSYSAEAQAARCAFCTAEMKPEQPTDPLEKAESFLPFVVDPQSAQGALHRWLGSLGWFRPSDLAKTASLVGLRPLYWTAWIVDATALVSWTADSNAGSRNADWAPHAGQTPMTFAGILVPATRGLSHAECQSLTRYFDLASARPGPAAPAQTTTECFGVQRSAARAIVSDAVHATAIERLQRGHIPGSRTRNVKASIVLSGLVTRRMALPTYVLAYEYKGTVYRALVHGQNVQGVFGKAPYDIGKILLVVGGVILAVVLLIVVLSALG
ncbi:Primosomal protein N' (replication factor Y) - superfamily II helicase [Labilithrix luteola]|uniref:Primosomal protein N' (Replication factor Y)-superfamily II helicase n=1 Tax=Labilithrix luteola TaxID=1391654 RepID=A0A0K1PTF2_9BACT|nr:Primosomal protein N' (replication factor Y) - superfamily II helicase [Labilithrix luteola]